jgi:ABC-2 type transport system ATP-binding protein
MSDNDRPIIEVARLSYEYPGLRALDDVGFGVTRGSITALVGPNGAGKTTLLRCLAGMDTPLHGNICIDGIDVIEEPRRSHTVVGYLPDSFGLYDDLSVRRGLTYVAAANGVPQPQVAALVEQTAAELGLLDRLEQRASELSRGLRQRVAIAQAIIHAPHVILLDEPAAGLDPEARYRLGELFVTLGRRGMTLIVSSHILAELEAYSTDMLILDRGRIVDHRRLRVDEGRHESLAIGVTEDPQRLVAALVESPLVSDIDTRDALIRCRFHGGATERAALLTALISRGLSIAHFAPLDEDLQQSYLRSMAHSGTVDES